MSVVGAVVVDETVGVVLAVGGTVGVTVEDVAESAADVGSVAVVVVGVGAAELQTYPGVAASAAGLQGSHFDCL